MTDEQRAGFRMQVLQLLLARGQHASVVEQLAEFDAVVRWVLLGEVPTPAPAPVATGG